MKKEAILSHELVDLATAISRIVKREFKGQAGTSLPSLTLFRMLHKIRGGVRHVGQLAEAFDISQPATSIMVDTMVTEGYLKRLPHATDRRLIELHLTAKATKALEVGYERAYKKIDRKISSLTAGKKKLLIKLARELTKLVSENES